MRPSHLTILFALLISSSAVAQAALPLSNRLPGVEQVRSIRIHDEWFGRGLVAGTKRHVTLRWQEADRTFTGIAELMVGRWGKPTCRTTVALQAVPAEVTRSFLEGLAGVQMEQGNYSPVHVSDDYPKTTIIIEYADSTHLRFFSVSAVAGGMPWRVSLLEGSHLSTGITESDLPARALQALNAHTAVAELRMLIDSAYKDAAPCG